MTGAQPGPLQNFEADVAPDTVRHTDETPEDDQPEFVGDLPDDPDQAVHYRPGEDQQ